MDGREGGSGEELCLFCAALPRFFLKKRFYKSKQTNMPFLIEDWHNLQ